MKFGQKLVYIILKHLQKNAVENITLSPRKLISKFWSTGATMGGRGLMKLFTYPAGSSWAQHISGCWCPSPCTPLRTFPRRSSRSVESCQYCAWSTPSAKINFKFRSFSPAAAIFERNNGHNPATRAIWPAGCWSRSTRLGDSSWKKKLDSWSKQTGFRAIFNVKRCVTSQFVCSGAPF